MTHNRTLINVDTGFVVNKFFAINEMPNDCLSRIYHLYYVIRERRVASPDFDEQPGIGSGKSPTGNMR